MKRKMSRYDREQQKRRAVRRAFTRRLRKVERELDAIAQVLLDDREAKQSLFDNATYKLYNEIGTARRAMYAALRFAPTR